MVFYAPEGQPTNPQFMPPKKRSGFATFLLIIGALFVGSIAVNALTSDPDSSSASDEGTAIETVITEEAAPTVDSPATNAPKPVEQPSNYEIGQPVTSEKFEYVVTDFNCGIPSVGEHEITREVAKGQYCQLSITAKNIANKAESLSFSDFELMSGEVEYSTESWLNITAASKTDSSGFLDKINPGLQVNGNIYFDVPLDVIPDRATVKDTLLGKPATVSLKK